MLIKGFLIRSYTSKELKKVGHDLVKLWEMFKSKTEDTTLQRYDITVSNINRTETLRYPDEMVDKGFILNVRLGVSAPIDLPGTENLPQYFVNVEDLDIIAQTIFSACSVNPTVYFRTAPTEIKRVLPPKLLSAR